MRFYMPTNVYVEKNCIQNHKQEMIIGKHALVVTGKSSSKKNGSLKDVLSVLNEYNVQYTIFDEVEENPSVELCEKGAKVGISNKVDFVIGIGGGSAMDAAKAMALLIQNPSETKDVFYVKKDLKAIPMIAIPTTCGTGSETTGKAVLSRPLTKQKGSMSHDVYPVLSLVDGKYLKGMPKQLLVNTSIDALAHLMESRLNSKANAYNKMISEYGLSLWKECKSLLQKEEWTEDEYELLMLTSSIAGMAIAQTGTSLPHALSYDLTCYYGVSHGVACGYYLASYLEAMDEKEIECVLSLLDFDSVSSFRAFIKECIGSFEISKENRDLFLDHILSNPAKLKCSPISLSKEDVICIVDGSILSK